MYSHVDLPNVQFDPKRATCFGGTRKCTHVILAMRFQLSKKQRLEAPQKNIDVLSPNPKHRIMEISAETIIPT